jgi:hypothetical protein
MGEYVNRKRGNRGNRGNIRELREKGEIRVFT